MLYLQLDNTTKQNKGRWLIAFLALLVEAGTFNKIIVSFLPVGHTHADIDQFFSRIASSLRVHDSHSRLDLERIIKSCRCSSSPWGAVNLVRHWENVANISGWLKKCGVVTMKAVTAYQQFRLMKSHTTTQVLLHAREWPGSQDEYWSGFTKNDTHQGIWSCAEVPNLLQEYDQVPCASGPTNPISKDHIFKVQTGVENQLAFLNAGELAKADARRLLKVFSTPAHSFPFAWNRDDISSLLGDENRNLVAGAAAARDEGQDEGLWLAKKDCHITENCFYLMQPTQTAVEPFWLAKVRRRVVDVDTGARMAHVQWWEPKQDQQTLPTHARNYFSCAYAPTTASACSISTLDKLALDEGFTIQLAVTVSEKGNVVHITAGRKETNYAHIKWYLMRWSPDSNMQMEDDELMPENLLVKGRIDTPAQKIRKTPKRRPKAPAEEKAAEEVAAPKKRKTAAAKEVVVPKKRTKTPATKELVAPNKGKLKANLFSGRSK